MNLLELDNIEVYIGTFYILQGVSLEIPPNEVTVLLGRNGAGKTTTMKAIIGMMQSKTGQIHFDGWNITHFPSHKIANLGIGYVPDTRRIFGTLSVDQNLIIAKRKDTKEIEEKFLYVYDLFPDLKKFRKRKAKTLSGGQQQMLAIARALINDNKLMLIDEPTEGLSPLFAKMVMDTLMEIKDKTTILLVEQNFKAATTIGKNYYIMDDGKIAYKGEISELIGNQELISKYLGVSVRGAN